MNTIVLNVMNFDSIILYDNTCVKTQEILELPLVTVLIQLQASIL